MWPCSAGHGRARFLPMSPFSASHRCPCTPENQGAALILKTRSRGDARGVSYCCESVLGAVLSWSSQAGALLQQRAQALWCCCRALLHAALVSARATGPGAARAKALLWGPRGLTLSWCCDRPITDFHCRPSRIDLLVAPGCQPGDDRPTGAGGFKNTRSTGVLRSGTVAFLSSTRRLRTTACCVGCTGVCQEDGSLGGPR